MSNSSVVDLTNAKEIAEHVSRMLIGAGSMPEFPVGSVPITEAAKILGKDANWVQAGIISGWLPIGKATKGDKLITSMEQLKRGVRTNYYISPRLLWELTGYVWHGKGEKRGETQRN